ncbi:hypothetical protein DFH07DRAFT_777934 [Mycena maculata]|uniref:Uncharacterized protein n=1 Tax=Mycena maculata TaxID=230809 RepID=A0AAD7IGH0_9AGAR|nr:hypothetical protein DFH07DRAFT_777934 [Mycena maculata]
MHYAHLAPARNPGSPRARNRRRTFLQRPNNECTVLHVAAALWKLKEERGLEIYVHANGTTRVQLDLVRSLGLKFDMLFSSELLGSYKSAPENYRQVLGLLKLSADKRCMRGETDDVWEDQEVIRSENDVYLEDTQKLDEIISRVHDLSLSVTDVSSPPGSLLDRGDSNPGLRAIQEIEKWIQPLRNMPD